MAKKSRILVVDDEAPQRELLSKFLEHLGYQVRVASCGNEALSILRDESDPFDVVLSDLSMPEMDGLELLKRGKLLHPDLQFILLTAYGSIESAIDGMKAGAADYFLKPVELGHLALRLQKILEVVGLEVRTKRLEKQSANLRGDGFEMVAESESMKKLLEEVDLVTATDTTVLLSGETGVGKEVLASYIHHKSSRSKQPFVPVNCSAIPENLLENEFFGHDRAAFTGADCEVPGFFEVADGGTLFLDEIGEMDLKLQPKILRALESRRVRRVGGRVDLPVDVRFIAATNRDLAQLVSEKRFREDLYYRLNVIHVRIPPLRERREDIPALTRKLVERYSRKLNVFVKAIDRQYIQSLSAYDFPGNVRELANFVERSLIYMRDGKLTLECLPRGGPGGPLSGNSASSPGISSAHSAKGQTLESLLHETEKSAISELIAACDGDAVKAAASLGISKASIYSKMSKYGIKTGA